jgi:hypothetical protein
LKSHRSVIKETELPEANPQNPQSDHPIAFLRGFIDRPKEVGSIIPSSRWMERRITRTAEVASANLVIELGPGTGGTTKALLNALAPGARLLAIEINPGFCDLLNNWQDWKGDEPLSFGTTRWYNIRFPDGCEERYCPVEVHTQSYSGDTKNGYLEIHQFRNLTNLVDIEGVSLPIADLPNVGQFHVDGYPEVDWDVTPPEVGELNVFTKPQTLSIARLRIKFFDDKRLKLLATCETASGALDGGYVKFCTKPYDGDHPEGPVDSCP